MGQNGGCEMRKLRQHREQGIGIILCYYTVSKEGDEYEVLQWMTVRLATQLLYLLGHGI